MKFLFTDSFFLPATEVFYVCTVRTVANGAVHYCSVNALYK